eukprot:7280294-Alexandrium_andersonii.AAC.1
MCIRDRATHVARLVGSGVRGAVSARSTRSSLPRLCSCCGAPATAAFVTPLGEASEGVAWCDSCLGRQD